MLLFLVDNNLSLKEKNHVLITQNKYILNKYPTSTHSFCMLVAL